MKKVIIITLIITGLFVLGLHISISNTMDNTEKGGTDAMENRISTRIATFAGGCFWCVESDFEKVGGVMEVISGYTGGHEEDPSYREVSSGGTGHVEAVQVVYDPDKVSYEELLDVFWRHVDPTDSGGQFVDRGSQYTTAIFFHDNEQKAIAEKSKRALEESGIFDKEIVTPIVEAGKFYEAEDYHQGYCQTHPLQYRSYRWNSGRDQFLKETWKDEKSGTTKPTGGAKYVKPSDDVLKKRLTPLQYKVTQHEGTEPSFDNEYWDKKNAGIYVDIVSGEPLFSSNEKYDSGTGWPSFTGPLVPENIVEKEDQSLFMKRTEVRSRYGDSHLGHVFTDGPRPTGSRYCINSAALRFIPAGDLEKEGYGEFSGLFKKKEK